MERRLIQQGRTSNVYSDKGSMTSLTSINGSYPTRSGVILVTDDKFMSSIPYIGHAAIVYSAKQVVESDKGQGVHFGSNNWNSSKNHVVGRSVIGTSMDQDAHAAYWAARQIGKGYSTDFMNKDRRDIFYCSQLVWAAYKDTTGVDLDMNGNLYGAAVAPLELMNTPKAYTIYQK
ncbi:hypothetical protein COO72_02305 [Bifidobacterium callitrichos]|nr:hypothetical protein COO72_02305 [Bifidobacterium callitrichos]